MVDILFDDIFRVEKLNPDDKKLFEKGIVINYHAFFSILSVYWLSLTCALLFLTDERRFLFTCLLLSVYCHCYCHDEEWKTLTLVQNMKLMARNPFAMLVLL